MRVPFVFASDIHGPFHDLGCLASLFYYIGSYKPGRIILGGDILDLYTLNTFSRGNLNGPKHLRDELQITKDEVILPLIKVSKKANPNVKIDWLEGNHEDRLQNRLLPRLTTLGLGAVFNLVPSIQEFFELEKHGIKYHSSKAGNANFMLTDHLTVMHGTRGGVNPARLEYSGFGASLLMGHSHKQSTHSVKLGNGDHHLALCSGCLCGDPSYADTNNWTLGFIAGWIDTETQQFGAWHETIVKSKERDKNGLAKKYDLYSTIGHITATLKDGRYVVGGSKLT